MDAQEISTAISNFVNSHSNPSEVVDHLSRDHRTLQQNVTRFAVAWLERQAENFESRNFDLRNEDSAKIGKAFVEAIPSDERITRFI